jgi:PAS domain S-box-containing protein
MDNRKPSIPLFLAGGGQMGAMMRAYEWSTSPLGAPKTWSASLGTGVGIMLNSAFPVFAAWGHELTFLYNDLFADILVKKHPDALGRPFQEIWFELWDDIQPLIARALEGEAIYTEKMPFRMLRRGYEEDTSFTFSYSPLRDENGAIRGLFCTCAETTQQVRADAEIRQLAQTLESRVAEATQERDRLWRNTQDIQVVINGQGLFQAVNPAFTAILGWTPDEVLGRSLFDFLVNDDEAPTQQALDDARVDKIPIIENRYRHKDGGFRWISWVAAPEGDQIYASGRHITAEKEQAEALRHAEDAMRQSQKLEAIGQLTGGVAHDFNNLLTVIRGSVDLLRRPGLTEERRARYTDAIASTADRAAKLTGQLLAFARRQALKPELFDAGTNLQAMQDIVGTLAGSRVRIEVIISDDPCFIEADPSQFDTAIINMAVNARDAMDGEGSLTFMVAATSRVPAVRSHPAVDGDYVCVSINDTGHGIAASEIDRIFEPFYTTKSVGQGTGLGLSQVFGFAKQSGGDVTVESTPGVGTTFALYLPRAPAPTSAGETQVRQVEDGLSGICVLVVEDNAEVGEFATTTLTELGYSTVYAPNAQAAIRELEHDADRFHIVFSDVIMPGMSGIELAKLIKMRHPTLPVVLTSGYSHVLAEEGSKGFELLHKPYSMEQLSRYLRAHARCRP